MDTHHTLRKCEQEGEGERGRNSRWFGKGRREEAEVGGESPLEGWRQEGQTGWVQSWLPGCVPGGSLNLPPRQIVGLGVTHQQVCHGVR